ncbi:hypothetical protein ABPG77_004687 [Micractinium sp. CCAP 211/92]
MVEGVRLAFWCLSVISAAHCLSQDVACPRELRSALADPDVAAIRLLPSVRWNFSREEWSEKVVVTRVVSLTGVSDERGQPPYLDVNQLTELIVVGANGSLLQSNLFLDDCLLPAMPLLCLAVAADNGRLSMHQLVLGDASCTDISQSRATDWLLKAAFWATWETRWARVNQRSIHVEDTGEVAGVPHGVRWRIANSTFRCTGNETHALLGASVQSARSKRGQSLFSALVATLLAAAAAIYYMMHRNVVTVGRNESPEVAAARSKGIVLQALIGQGTFGRVFRAQWRQGRVVAVKIVELPSQEQRAAGAVARECRHALSCRHQCIAATLAAFTVTVRTHPRCRQLLARLLREGYAHMNSPPQDVQRGGAQGGSAPPVPAGQQPAAAGPLSEHAPAAAEGSAALAGAPGSPSSGGSSGGSSSEGAVEGVMTLLVMEYCSLGSLHRAIASGRFLLDRHAGLPNLCDWAARTALDIALGLAHLHSECLLVHRDVSTNNVLLVPDPSDPRGFRAKLSDFGLATLLQDRQAQPPSLLKGTPDFMPPEMFTQGGVHCAQDVYGLGIILFCMCTGASPYAGLAPFQVGGWAAGAPCLPPSGAGCKRRSASLAACAPCWGVQPRLLAGFLACLRPVCHPCAASREGALQVVGRKLEEAHKRAPLGMPHTVPAGLQRLVWDCTHWDPCARPEAGQVAHRLEALLAAGLEKAELGQPSKACSSRRARAELCSAVDAQQ